MPSQMTIPKKKRNEPLDHGKLFEVGLEHVQRLSHRIWTDYNIHDPGVTTLELLCYTLTDLSYRASYEVKDLLAPPPGMTDSTKSTFFTAREILTNRPLTPSDYRKLLIDLKGVRNAWLAKSPLPLYADTVAGELLTEKPDRSGIRDVSIAGLYDVLVDYESTVTKAQMETEKEVRRVLQANRNLCEDFVVVKKVGTQEFNLCSEIELSPELSMEALVKLNARLLFEVEQYFDPPVRNYTLSEMLERKKPDGTPFLVEEIFEGPKLRHGFIDDYELQRADLRTEILLSDIISIIMDIEGIIAVREISVNPLRRGAPVPPADKWRIPVEPGKKPVIGKSRFVFYRRNLPVTLQEADVRNELEKLRKGAIAHVETENVDDFPVPAGRSREPGSYYSFQNHFPEIYGLSSYGVGKSAGEKRRARAYQLKGYLLFFDQVMANYLAQLSHVRELFSLDEKLHATYFYQAVDSFADYERIYRTDDASVSAIGKKLAETFAAVEGEDLSIERRNRFLDHLIARFAERFTEFAHVMYTDFGAGPASLIGYKCEFLSNYPSLGSERSLAYNHTLNEEKDLWDSANISGLERRLASLLGIRNSKRRDLHDLLQYDIYCEIDTTPGDEFRFRIRKEGEIILSSSRHFKTKDEAKQEMMKALHYAQLPWACVPGRRKDGKYYFTIVDDMKNIVAIRKGAFKTEDDMKREMDELVSYATANWADEGMYLIENILLRPEPGSDDPFLRICAASVDPEPAALDPYSYRMHVILPAYGRRFGNMHFRRYAEEVIRQETPAHILPKVCWISREDMILFEELYREWIRLKGGVDTSDRRSKLLRFFCTLFSIKNVYPSERLQGCGGEGGTFILNQSSLGTKKGTKNAR